MDALKAVFDPAHHLFFPKEKPKIHRLLFSNFEIFFGIKIPGLNHLVNF